MNEKIKLEPWGQNIMIKADEPPKETNRGSIILPQGQKAPLNIGTVIAVGPGRKHGNGFREPMCIQVGWRVIYPPYGAQEVEHGGVKYLILDENAILAIETA